MRGAPIDGVIFFCEYSSLRLFVCEDKVYWGWSELAVIAIDAACWANRRGYGRYMREVFRELWRLDRENRYILIADGQTARLADFPSDVPTRIVELKQSPAEGAVAGGRRRISDMLALGRMARRVPCDVFFFSSVFSYFPYWGSARVVVAVHDVIYHHYPSEIFPDYRSRLFWRMKMWLALREADRIVTVSEYSRQQIAEAFRIRAEELVVVSEGPSRVFVDAHGSALRPDLLTRAGLESGERYYLYVGGFAPHKNLSRLIAAYKETCDALCEQAPSLILVGENKKEGFYSNLGELLKQIEREGLGDRVRFTGYLSDEDLALFYANAVGLILPSLEEGFGLPAVEAAASGTPVIATRNSPLPELLEGGGIFIDPTDESELRSAMEVFALKDEQRQRMGETARSRATKLSWKAAARALKACFEETALART